MHGLPSQLEGERDLFGAEIPFRAYEHTQLSILRQILEGGDEAEAQVAVQAFIAVCNQAQGGGRSLTEPLLHGDGFRKPGHRRLQGLLRG